MSKVQETQLPGVGVRHDFTTQEGDRVGVITHRTGRRDLLLYDREDADACAMVVRLEEDDSHTLADLLGGTQVAQRVAKLQQSVEGLTIDWLPITPAWACAGLPIRETRLRAQTGVSVVAVVRDGETIPAPDPDFRLQVGDTAVVVGTPAGIREAFRLLHG